MWPVPSLRTLRQHAPLRVDDLLLSDGVELLLLPAPSEGCPPSIAAALRSLQHVASRRLAVRGGWRALSAYAPTAVCTSAAARASGAAFVAHAHARREPLPL